MSSPRPASLARRAFPALVLTGASLGLLAKLDSPSAASGLGPAPTGNEGTDAVLASGSGAPDTTGSPSSAAPAPTHARTPTQPAQTIPLPASKATTATTAPATSKAPATPKAPTATKAPATTVPAAPKAASCSSAWVNGDSVFTRWGYVQVSARFTGNKQLCDVKVMQYPSDHGRSVAINQYALPILHDQAVAAKSSGIQGVSGATVTSAGYQRSLQSAIDRA